MTSAAGLDTNVLVRYYVDDEDPEGSRQRELARKLMESGQPLAVCKTVLLEFEWVLRGYYEFSKSEVARVYAHLLTQKQLEIEDRFAVERAVDALQSGLDFADALHHASYSDCAVVVSFDNRGFARRASRLKLQPPVRFLG